MKVAVAAAAALLVFVAPLYVPLPPFQSVSTSYMAGFSNTFAIRSAVVLSFLVFLWSAWRHRRRPAWLLSEEHADHELGQAAGKLRWTFLSFVLLANAAVLAWCGALVAASGTRYLGDAGYIIEQAGVLRDTGRALYSQVEFAYGPLLVWPVVWISRLLGSNNLQVAYFVALVVESSLGILLLAYIVNQVPMRSSVRKWALALFTLAAVTPHLGLNYTYFRFASPLALLLFATREKNLWRCALILSLGEVIELLISPELALAFTVGAVVFGTLRAFKDSWLWSLAGFLPVLTLGLLLRTAAHTYFQMAASFSRGALSLPVGPYPHILILLVALVWIVPFCMGRLLRRCGPEDARLLAFYATSVAFMQAALGRSDPVHVVFNGLGIFVLSLFGLRAAGRRAEYAWIITLALLVLWSQFVNQRFFQLRTAGVLAQTVLPRLPKPVEASILKLVATRRPSLAEALTPKSSTAPEFPLTAFEALVGSGCVSTPLDIDPSLEEALQASHHYQPGYYAFWVNMMNPAAEERSIHDARQCPWMLLPQFRVENVQTPSTLAALQGLGLPYRTRNESLYLPGAALQHEIEARWTPVARYGPYSLLKQTGVREPGH